MIEMEAVVEEAFMLLGSSMVLGLSRLQESGQQDLGSESCLHQWWQG